MSGDPEQDHLAEGFRLDIQAALIRVSELFLIATGTVNSYRSSNVEPVQAGRQMGVRFVLEGGIRKVGHRIRLNAELTDSIAQQIIWADHYDRSLEDVLAVSDEVATELIDVLGVKLIIGKESKIFQNTLKSFEVKDLFYQGMNLSWMGRRPPTRRTIPPEGFVAGRTHPPEGFRIRWSPIRRSNSTTPWLNKI